MNEIRPKALPKNSRLIPTCTLLGLTLLKVQTSRKNSLCRQTEEA
uniref:Uncharacterized protein n=1 Tax=Anguilla anguilla TaxID=7936 RepID=A0A0E9RUV4_ANGAN